MGWDFGHMQGLLLGRFVQGSQLRAWLFASASCRGWGRHQGEPVPPRRGCSVAWHVWDQLCPAHGWHK